MFILLYLPVYTFESIYLVLLLLIFLSLLFLEFRFKTYFSKKELFLCFYSVLFLNSLYSLYFSTQYYDFLVPNPSVMSESYIMKAYTEILYHVVLIPLFSFVLIFIFNFLSRYRKIL